MRVRFISFTIVVLLTERSFGANLLFLTALAAPSHHIWNEALVGGLLENGHNITLLGHDKPKIKSSNYTVLYVEVPYADDFSDPTELSKLNAAQNVLLEWDYQFFTCETDLKSEALKKLMTYPADHFEMIVIDVGAGQHLYPLLDFFSNATAVGVSPFRTPPYIADVMGHQIPSYVPIYSSRYGNDMNLWERTHNFLLQTLDLGLKYYNFGAMKKMSQKVFGEGIRDPREIERDIVLLLANSDPILDYPQPFPSNIIPVGGLHIKPPKKLSEDLQNILDNARHGAIFFSMGSIVKSSAMRRATKTMFLDVFKKLKQVVLWKFEDDGLDVPENVIIRKWFPQSDILAHKNVVLFVSHCGGLSTQEATYYGVPVIGIPIFVDQHNNAAKIAHKGGGLLLNYYELSYEMVHEAVAEVLGNPRYRKEMKRLSALHRDQQIPPLEKAVFWIEYLLRNKAIYNDDFSPKGRYMEWYQLYNAHILIFVILFTGLLLVFGGGMFIAQRFRRIESKKVKKA